MNACWHLSDYVVILSVQQWQIVWRSTNTSVCMDEVKMRTTALSPRHHAASSLGTY